MKKQSYLSLFELWQLDLLYQADSFDPQNVSEKEDRFCLVLTAYMPRMRNNNLQVRFAGSYCSASGNNLIFVSF